jgi:hypothetical protein
LVERRPPRTGGVPGRRIGGRREAGARDANRIAELAGLLGAGGCGDLIEQVAPNRIVADADLHRDPVS